MFYRVIWLARHEDTLELPDGLTAAALRTAARKAIRAQHHESKFKELLIIEPTKKTSADGAWERCYARAKKIAVDLRDADLWDEHPVFDRECHEDAETQRGYWDWVLAQIEEYMNELSDNVTEVNDVLEQHPDAVLSDLGCLKDLSEGESDELEKLTDIFGPACPVQDILLLLH